MDEMWLPVVGYEGLYEVSSMGRVRSIPRPYTRGGLMRIEINKRDGYGGIRLSLNGAKKHLSVHSLVATAFLGLRPEGYECRHLNGDRTDNRLGNLRWGTSAENSQDMVAHGHSNSRITHCPQDHEYTPENTYVYDGRRYCKACNRVRTREGQRRRRARLKKETA